MLDGDVPSVLHPVERRSVTHELWVSHDQVCDGNLLPRIAVGVGNIGGNVECIPPVLSRHVGGDIPVTNLLGYGARQSRIDVFECLIYRLRIGHARRRALTLERNTLS
jgi:hypothetical protein